MSNSPFKAIRISEHVWWVGAIDWHLRDFHGYATERGTTYNAFLVMGEQITLVDTVKAPFYDEMLARICDVVDPTRIDYIISNHAEMDHSGALPQLVDLVHPRQVFASSQGVKALDHHFHRDLELVTVDDGAALMLGGLHLQFYEARMLHWPDSMFSYLAEDGVLFTNDAFGMHLATTERFADEIDPHLLRWEAGKYVANILLPYAPLITKLLARVGELALDIRALAPDHGPVWRTNIPTVLDWYGGWAQQRPTKKAVVVYDTMWGSTALMARAISEGLQAGGAQPTLLPLNASHRSDIATELLEAGALLVGSPTLNNHMFPPVADVLTYLKGLRPKNLVGAAFGSYGWGGEGVGQVQEMLEAMKVELVGDGLKAKYVPDAAMLDACYDLGYAVAGKLREKIMAMAEITTS